MRDISERYLFYRLSASIIPQHPDIEQTAGTARHGRRGSHFEFRIFRTRARCFSGLRNSVFSALCCLIFREMPQKHVVDLARS